MGLDLFMNEDCHESVCKEKADLQTHREYPPATYRVATATQHDQKQQPCMPDKCIHPSPSSASLSTSCSIKEHCKSLTFQTASNCPADICAAETPF